VTAGTYGDEDNVAQVTVDAYGRITSASNVAISSSAGGTVTSITAAADSGSGTAITTSGTLTFSGGTGITTSVSGTTVTIDADNNGTVTSVAVSGGSTGLTTSGGPIETSGTITIAGTLVEGNGGTGQSTYTKGDLLSAHATNSLGKLGIGTANQVLTVHETNGVAAWADPAAAIQAEYVVLSAHADLDNERVLTAGTALTSVDAGAGSTVTINHDNYGTAGSYGSATLVPVITTNAQGHVTGVSTAANPQGTVTSIDVSGGSTGLTTSGGAVTSSGTITIGGTLIADNGGTGLDATSYTKGDIIYCSDVTDSVPTLDVLGIGSEDDVLTVSSGGLPSWAAGGGGGGGMTSFTIEDDLANTFTVSDDTTVLFTNTDGEIDISVNDNVEINLSGISDARLKENVQPLHGTIDKLDKLCPVEFDWNAQAKEVKGKEGHEAGLIAQEVEEIFPEMVTERDGFKHVNYQKLTPLLLAAVKDLNERLNALEHSQK
jgi:hypothetical protein